MIKALLFICAALWSLPMQAQTTALQWYKKAMLHLAEPDQNISVSTKMTFTDGRILEDAYKYAIKKQDFYAHFSGRDIILNKDWFMNLDINNGIMLIDVNENEGDSKERLSSIIDQFNANALLESNSSNADAFFSISDLEDGRKKIEINYPEGIGMFSNGTIVFNSETLEIQSGRFNYSENNPNRFTSAGEMESIYVSYVFNKFNSKDFLQINDVMRLENNAIEILEPYRTFKVYNMSGVKIIN